MAQIMDDKELNEIATAVGERYGYKEVQAHFTAFRDMKVKWCRSYNWIEFDVSDYVACLTPSTVESILDTIFKRIKGKTSGYTQKVSRALNSKKFVKANQETFISRCRDVYDKGNEVDLDQVYDLLVAKGLMEKDPQVRLMWGPSKMEGYSSTLMKAVVLNSRLDDKSLPSLAIEYALYRQLAFLSMGFSNGKDNKERHDRYEALLNEFFDADEAKEQLKAVGIFIN